MFREKFGSYVCDDDTISVRVKRGGFVVTAKIVHDDSGEAPWERDCLHGPVSDWTLREKRPGERVLSVAERGGHRRFYDFAAAVAAYKRDGGWVLPGTEGMTKGQRAVRSAEHDMAVLRAWCRDEWWYVGVVLSVERKGVVLDKHAASLWGIECNYPDSDNAYLNTVANELLPEALAEARKIMADLCECGESV